MMVAFVGFIGASTQEVFGPDLPLLTGIAGAGVATFFTSCQRSCSPSAARGDPRRPKVHRAVHRHHRRGGGGRGQPGGILAWHVLWQAGTDAAPFTGAFQWFAAVVSVTALALAKFKRDVLEVIGACAGLGLWYSFATG